MSKEKTNYSDERFSRLSNKITKLQNVRVQSPSKILDIETRIDNLHIESLRNIKDLDHKMKFLEDELFLITRMIEDSINSKNSLRIKISNEIKETENKMQLIFERERQIIIEENAEIFKNFELKLIQIQEINNKERFNINNYVKELREVIESDIEKLKSDTELLKEERLSKFSLIVNSMKDEFKCLNELVFYLFNFIF
jgi:hypothetical protein